MIIKKKTMHSEGRSFDNGQRWLIDAKWRPKHRGWWDGRGLVHVFSTLNSWSFIHSWSFQLLNPCQLQSRKEPYRSTPQSYFPLHRRQPVVFHTRCTPKLYIRKRDFSTLLGAVGRWSCRPSLTNLPLSCLYSLEITERLV